MRGVSFWTAKWSFILSRLSRLACRNSFFIRGVCPTPLRFRQSWRRLFIWGLFVFFGIPCFLFLWLRESIPPIFFAKKYLRSWQCEIVRSVDRETNAPHPFLYPLSPAFSKGNFLSATPFSFLPDSHFSLPTNKTPSLL